MACAGSSEAVWWWCSTVDVTSLQQLVACTVRKIEDTIPYIYVVEQHVRARVADDECLLQMATLFCTID